MRWAGHVARTGEERKVYKGFVGKLEGKWLLGRLRRRWEDDMDRGILNNLETNLSRCHFVHQKFHMD
jgi:hypothetical protein